MTTDLFRLFSQYYLKIQRFGYISQFVCDFIEDHHGIMYLLQVKSFECEGVLHEWQRPFQPTKSIPMADQAKEEAEVQERKCEVAILCKQP